MGLRTMGVNLDTVVNHIDHLCQLAGNANQVGIGSDLDGGFGKEQCPYDLETIADHQKIIEILKNRNYKEGEIENIIGKNWIRFLQNAWKE